MQIFAPTSGVINSTLLRWGWISENIPFLTDGPTAIQRHNPAYRLAHNLILRECALRRTLFVFIHRQVLTNIQELEIINLLNT